MKYDLIDLPGEIADNPECGACFDGGFIDKDETVFCDCAAGVACNAFIAEIEAEFRAEEKAERMGTDYAYAVDSQGDDSPPDDWF